MIRPGHVALLAIVGTALAALGVAGYCGAASAQPFGDSYIGTYEGGYRAIGRAELPATGIVVSEGPGLYRTTVQFREAAPAEGFQQLELHGGVAGMRVTFLGYSNSAYWHGEVAEGKLLITRGDEHYGGQFELKLTEHHSPTEGQAPPKGAVVLLPFEEGKPSNLDAWKNKEWKVLPDGSVQVASGKGANYTVQQFGDMQMHIEFNLPHLPLAFGQGRANSGIYIQNRYELQILDSFGVLVSAGDCGAFYQLSTPRVNANFPPERWQTYDVTFRAPRLDSGGTQREPAKVTVLLNGVSIQEDLVLEHPSPGGAEKPAEKDCIQIQDHGNPIRFRNAWVAELKE